MLIDCSEIVELAIFFVRLVVRNKKVFVELNVVVEMKVFDGHKIDIIGIQPHYPRIIQRAH